MRMQLHRSATAAATFQNGVWTHLRRHALLLEPQCAHLGKRTSETRRAWLKSCRWAAGAGLHRLPEDAGCTCWTGTHSRQTWMGGSHPARAECVAGQLGITASSEQRRQ
jgi:hypothetical protein